MNTFLIISLLTLLIGIILFIKERRSIFTGFILVLGFIEVIFYFFIFLSSNYEFGRILILLTVYGIIPLSIIVTGFLLIKNGNTMKIKEGRRFANLLSLFAGLYILIIILLSTLLIYKSSDMNVFIYMSILITILISLYFGFLFMIYIVYCFIYQQIPLKSNVNFIIILGSGLIGDKVPPLLRSRLDKGIEIYKQQVLKGNYPQIITSGGQGSDELTSESDAMKKYLISQNIPDSDVIIENKSTTTYENMKFSKRIMDRTPNYNCIFVTNNYHVFRASIYSRKAGLKAHGVGSPTSFYFLPSALIREYIAILVLYKWVHVIFILLFLIFIVISMLPFNLF